MRATAPPITLVDLDELATTIDHLGVDAVDHDVLVRLAAVAALAGASLVLAEVLADPAQPPVARERAFGRLALALAAAGSPDRSPDDTPGDFTLAA